MLSDVDIRVELALRFTRETVTGEVRAPDGETTPFSGWIGLIAAIERLRPQAAQESLGCDPVAKPRGSVGSSPGSAEIDHRENDP